MVTKKEVKKEVKKEIDESMIPGETEAQEVPTADPQIIADIELSGKITYDGKDKRIVQLKMEQKFDREGNLIEILGGHAINIDPALFPEDFNPLRHTSTPEGREMEHDHVEGEFILTVTVMRHTHEQGGLATDPVKL